MKVSDELPVRPAALVSLAVMVWLPCARPVGVNDHTPLALAVVVPSTVEPSLSVTVALASAVPVRASLDVMLSVDDAGIVRQRHRHGGRRSIVGEGQRRAAGEPGGIGLAGGDGLAALRQAGRGERPHPAGIGGRGAEHGRALAQRHRRIGIGSAGQGIVGR